MQHDVKQLYFDATPDFGPEPKNFLILVEFHFGSNSTITLWQLLPLSYFPVKHMILLLWRMYEV